jgi:predicted ester cyclase
MIDANKRIARKFVEDVINTGDLDRVAEFIAAPDVAAARQHVLSVRDAYPDLHVTVSQQIAEDDFVVTVVTARGTHKGSFWGIPASNKLTTIEGVNIDRIRDGKIVEHKGVASTLEGLMAANALPWQND